jgi:hypothetical protein
MSGPCGDRISMFSGRKAIAYAIGPDGRRTRLTRHQLLTGRFPDGTSQVVFAPVGHVSDHALSTAPELLRLDPGAASALARARSQSPSRLAAVPGAARQESAVLVGTASDRSPKPVPADVTYTVYDIGGRKVTFGVQPGATVAADALPRNPYVLSGHPPGTPEGERAALRYTAALAALYEGRICSTCGPSQACDDCRRQVAQGTRPDMRRVAHLVPAGQFEDTFVDALVLAAGAGDTVAAAELEALAVAGEHLIGSVAQTTEVLSPDTIERALRMERDEFQSWYETRREELSSEFGLRDAETVAAYAAVTDLSTAGDRDALLDAERRRDLLSARRDRVERQISDLEALRVARAYGTAALDGEGLFLVHETAHDPAFDADGNILASPRGDIEPDGVRDTWHATLNHLVQGHAQRAGSSSRRAIVVSMAAFLEANPGALGCLSPVDMQLSPPPRQPLRLPAEGTTVVEYSSDDPDGRAAQVEEVIARQGGSVFPQGPHYSAPHVEDLLKVFAAYQGAFTGLHHSSGSGSAESALLGANNGSLDFLPVRPSFSAYDMRSLGRNGRLRLFDRGGDGDAGRPTGREFVGMQAAEPAPDEGYNF